MIDAESGRILIEGDVPFSVAPGLTRNAFLAATAVRPVEALVENGPWKSYSFRCRILNRDWALGLTFKGETLHTVAMALATANESWSNWSEAEERRKLAEHDELLNTALGAPPYTYPWGQIRSTFDRKTGGSSISIQYRD